jgi:hypothetical protein
MLNNLFFLENHAVYEIVWKNKVIVEQTTEKSIIWRMRFACWITKATNTHLQYVILIVFPLQLWLQ